MIVRLTVTSFFRFEDRTKHLQNISSLPDSVHKLNSLNGLNGMVKYCITPVCRRQQIASYFQEECAVFCDQSCDICSSSILEHPTDCNEDAIEVLNCLDSMQQIQPKVCTNKFNEKGLMTFVTTVLDH